MKRVICKTAGGGKVVLYMKPTGAIIGGKGLDVGGKAQTFHTANCLRRIVKYMPFGAASGGGLVKLTVAQTVVSRPEIVTRAPQSRFLFHGKLMVSDVTGSAWARKNETKHVVDKNLDYFKGKNPQAGPRWDKALSINEGRALAADLQRYLKRGG